MDVESPAAPKPNEISVEQIQFREISVTPHLYAPLEKAWAEICRVIYEEMEIDIQMNLKAPTVELKTRIGAPTDLNNLQKCADLLRAFMLGFNISDAVVIFRIDDLRVESFEIEDLRRLKWHYLTQRRLENLTRTKIVIENENENSMVHVLGGSSADIQLARVALNSLIVIQSAPDYKRGFRVRALISAIQKD